MKITLVRTALAALVPSALAALVACQSVHRSPQPTTDMEEVAGRYALFGIDGKPVPATVEHGGAPVEVRSGTFVIGADGEAQIVNSRIHQNILIVDRLVGAAELRLGGGERPQKVRVERTDGRPAS